MVKRFWSHDELVIRERERHCAEDKRVDLCTFPSIWYLITRRFFIFPGVSFALVAVLLVAYWHQLLPIVYRDTFGA